MEIQGHISDGVVVPDGDIDLPEGTQVTILLPSSAAGEPNTMTTEALERYQAALAKMDALSSEQPTDAFSGANHDAALYGDRR